MSILVVAPGDLVRLGLNEKKRIAFDWDYENLSIPAGAAVNTSTYEVRVIKQNGATAMTYDNNSILSAADATIALERTVSEDDRATIARIVGETAEVGDVYVFANRIVTNEPVPKQSEQSIRVQIVR